MRAVLALAITAARYNIDLDLITRSAGFGYFGSVITSIIFAGFTFIFFALEGSIMAQGLLVGLGICISFRASVINIGGEGQFYVGALATALAGGRLRASHSPPAAVAVTSTAATTAPSPCSSRHRS